MKIKNLFIFGAGLAIGAGVTYKILKDKYEQLIQEEIDSVKEVFGRGKTTISADVDNKDKKEENANSKQKVEPLQIGSKDKKDYENMIAYHRYATPSDEDEVIEEPDNGVEIHEIERDDFDRGDCYIIPPNEVGALCDYDLVTLTYYADGVLTDEMDEIVDGVGSRSSKEFVNHFGEFEEDTVYVRDNVLKCDYEIARDIRKYSEVVVDYPPHYV